MPTYRAQKGVWSWRHALHTLGTLVLLANVSHLGQIVPFFHRDPRQLALQHDTG